VASPPPTKSRIIAVEATGILLIALAILIFTVIRYWHNIPWSWR